MDVTVVVNPRECFSRLPLSLASLLRTIPESVPVIVNDGGAPEEVRSQIRALKANREFVYIEPEHFILPPVARNMALEMVETEYVVYVDNDLKYDDGWLEAMVRTAEENEAGAVCPVTLLGPLPKRMIHHAGSTINAYVDENGLNRISSEHRLEWVALEEARENDWNGISMENDEFEYHCALIRTSVMREIGGHDERQTHYDHLNDSLRIKAMGHKIFLAPDAVVEYLALHPFEDYDWPYFCWRWTDENSRMSAEQIAEAFGVWKNPPGDELIFVRTHRARAVKTLLPKWMNKVRPFRIQGWILDREIARRQKLAPKPLTLEQRYVAPRPKKNALETAGIPGAETLHINGSLCDSN
ncbi:glycosyltransferase [Hyphomonas sp. BRH_c22]|uniref:glycosyltransferase family 2 protein n=1 Tax=Hyphomonas sp. BRH_c22 TaxID=1629710 RepID=UPI0005F0CD0D|nr:glycosyltransferase [Hyphomonas sp. BRH_c22]